MAHAGGGINGLRYCNCLEALDHNYAQGHRLVEMDFSVTGDGHWVLIHDWQTSRRGLFGGELVQGASWRRFPTRAMFMNRRMLGGYTQLSVEDLVD